MKVHIDVAENSELMRAREFLKAGRWGEAVETIRRVSENEGRGLLMLEEDNPASQEYSRYLTVQRICDHLLASAQFVNEPCCVLTVEVVTRLLGGQEIEHRIDGDLDTAPAPTQRVNQFVACYSSHPGTERLAGVPGVAL